MKCLMFCDPSLAANTVAQYNNWAQNKVLAKDVIVHSHVANDVHGVSALIIVVFFDERMHPDWVSKVDTQT